MLKNSKSMIFRTHDQLLNAIHKKTQSCYHQHHHYYHNDLIYTCNKNHKKNRQHKRKNQNKKRNKTVSKGKTGTFKRSFPTCYNNESIRTFESIQSNRNSTTKLAINSLSNVCFCACEYRVNFKVFYQLDNSLKDICVYFEENFINLQLVLVIIVFALITCTAQNIDTQVKPQLKPFTSQTFLVTSFNDAVPPTAINLNNSLHTIYCFHRIPNAFFSLRSGAENSFNYQAKFFRTLRQNRYHLCLKDHKRHMQAIIRKISFWLTNIQNNPSNHLNTTNYLLHSNIYIGEDGDGGNHNDSAIIVIKTQQQNNNNNTIIKVKNNIAKDDQQKHQFQIQNSNIKKYLNNLTNKYYNKSVSYKTNQSYNKITNETKPKVGKVNDYVSKNILSFNNHDDQVKIKKNFQMELKLLSSSNRSHQPVNVHDEQVDHTKLMNLVLDGLGLKNVPNVEKMNISQLEYVTKYREYLQRAHLRKRRDLINEKDETSLRPLEILSIVTKNRAVIQHRLLKRQKRNSFGSSHDNNEYNNQNPLVENDKKQSLEERVRNILFLKKKHQKPRSTKKERDSRKSNIRLMFALEPEFSNLTSHDIEEANIRLILIHSPILAIKKSKNKKLHTKPKGKSCGSSNGEVQKNPQKENVLNMKLYFLPPRGKKVLLDGRKIDIKVDQTMPEETHTQWLQFDATRAVKTAIDEKRLNHVVLELQCDNCKRTGARILNEAYNTADDALAHQNSTDDHQLMPVLNIIGHFDKSQRSVRPHQYEKQNAETSAEGTKHRHYHHQAYNNDNENRENRRTNCYKPNQRCCRHSMEVVFKEIKGFEFIIQPKVFDAGYCHGRCPPRYNPAHHHALLQSLIWKQNHRKAPRPCCAPSKLIELEVLHVDEKDSNKLKISTWSDMKVVECGCS